MPHYYRPEEKFVNNKPNGSNALTFVNQSSSQSGFCFGLGPPAGLAMII